jgi:diadenosine tetraphosphate (Ap4A) HIT family hydrolase
MNVENKYINDSNCSICIHLGEKSPFEVKVFSDSVLYLNEDQFFKGYCILEYKRHAKELFDLTDEARNLYIKHLSLAAKALQKAFNPDKINYELLGNKVPHLHWHIIPRFKEDPAWSDPVWSMPHDPLKPPADRINQFVSDIQKYL